MRWFHLRWSNTPLRRPTVSAMLAATILGIGPAMSGAPLKVVVFDIEPVELPQTAQIRTKLKAEADLIHKLVSDKGLTVVDTMPQAKKIEDSLPLSQCNGCDQDIAKALGADIEIAVAMQAVSAATFSLSGSLKDVKTDRVLRQGVVDIRGENADEWAHGMKFLVKERLFDPPLPSDAAGLAAAAEAAKKDAGGSAN